MVVRMRMPIPMCELVQILDPVVKKTWEGLGGMALLEELCQCD